MSAYTTRSDNCIVNSTVSVFYVCTFTAINIGNNRHNDRGFTPKMCNTKVVKMVPLASAVFSEFPMLNLYRQRRSRSCRFGPYTKKIIPVPSIRSIASLYLNHVRMGKWRNAGLQFENRLLAIMSDTQRQLPQIRCGSTQITSAFSDERHLSCTQDEGGGDKYYRARK